LNEIQDVLPVHTKHAAGAGAVSILGERGHGGDDFGFGAAGTVEIRSAAITKAGPTGVVIVR